MITRKILALVAACTLAFASTASAVTLRITDRNLQGLIAQGDLDGKRLTLRIDASASGPVMVFVIDGNNVVSYPATLQNGQVVLEGQNGMTLAKFLAARGVTLTTETVNATGSRSHTLPGLNTTPTKPPETSTDPARPTTNGGDTKGSSEGKGNGKGKDNGKDEKEKDKEQDKGKGKP